MKATTHFIFYKRQVALLVIFIFCLISSGCYLHSDEQEDLANDIFARYKVINPAGDTALQNLDADLKKLLDTQRINTNLLTGATENSVVEGTWGGLTSTAGTLQIKLAENIATNKKQAKLITEKKKELAGRKTDLEAVLESMNKALAKLEGKRTLEERLEIAKSIINTTSKAINRLIPTAPATPYDKRLKSSIEDVIDYLDAIDNKEVKTEKTFSLVLESLRLGRDIVSLQIEAIEIEEGHLNRMQSIYEAENQLLLQTGSIQQYTDAFRDIPAKYDSSGKVAQTIQKMSEAAHNAPERPTRRDERPRSEIELDLKNLLDSLGKFQTLRITTDGRLDDLELRRTVETYRRARLLDASYERQRIVLISTGLDGVVRYSQGGWRREDIARLTNIFGTIAQVVVAVRATR